MIAAFNAIISGVGSAVAAVLYILPDTPFNFVQTINSGWLKAICWIFPIQEAIVHLTAFVSCVVIYYGIRILMRWLKVAGS